MILGQQIKTRAVAGKLITHRPFHSFSLPVLPLLLWASSFELEAPIYIKIKIPQKTTLWFIFPVIYTVVSIILWRQALVWLYTVRMQARRHEAVSWKRKKKKKWRAPRERNFTPIITLTRAGPDSTEINLTCWTEERKGTLATISFKSLSAVKETEAQRGGWYLDRVSSLDTDQAWARVHEGGSRVPKTAMLPYSSKSQPRLSIFQKIK